MTDPENAESREKAKKILSNVLVVVICVFIAFLVSSFVTNFVAHPTKVEGESMETTLTDGDTVIIQKLSYYFGTPDRYDVVVFPVYNSETYYIKRVIGLPGETVQIDEGKIFINDKELEDDIYGKDEYIDDPGDAGEPITLASDEYFVLGDNRNMSTDSRSSYVGVIKKKNIVGKAWRRVLPFSKAGKIQQ
ncbi:MAG: signal peptidase I [Lachnospiraceae bacterium]|nr:signal peptidase I [Lachnospiraceae bacterium]